MAGTVRGRDDEVVLKQMGNWWSGDRYGDAALKGRLVRWNYSGWVSEVPENAATIAGEMTIKTKVTPIRRSCMRWFSLVESA
jgi:hypothetical protein